MSAFTRNSYKKRKHKTSYPKVDHVYDTYNNEKMWIVKTVDGKRRKLSKNLIDLHDLLTPQTTFTIRRLGCMARYEVGKEFRFVFWQGFKNPSQEPPDFKPTIVIASSDEEGSDNENEMDETPQTKKIKR